MNWVFVTAERIKRVTDKAILIEIADDEGEVTEHWLPKSQLEEPNKFEQGDQDITVGMSQWIAEQKGIETE